METYENGHRFTSCSLYESRLHEPYDYARDGLANKTLSHKIVETTNPLLQSILSYYEYALVFMLKFGDNLKQFKNFNWKNR